MLPISLPRSPTKRTKGVQRPKLPEPPLRPPAERARDPRPPGSPGLQVADPDNLHPRLVALAKAPPSPSRPRSLQAATTCATVVLDDCVKDCQPVVHGQVEGRLVDGRVGAPA